MNAKELISYIKDGNLDSRLMDIYQTQAEVSIQQARYVRAVNEFRHIFNHDTSDEVHIFSAPGRTEVCGNHTDHQHGEVLAASISDDAIAVVSPRDDGAIQLLSEGYDMMTIRLDQLDPHPEEEGTTKAIIRGVLARLRENGHAIGGFNAYVTSDVLSGSGLSSSAAFETIVGTILSCLYNEGTIDAVEIAKVGQYAENVYFGKPCGLMDQMACSVGSLCHIDFSDPSDPVVERIDFSLTKAGYSLCITDTKGSHADLTPDYAAVPDEMKQVAALFDREVLHELPEDLVLKNAPLIREKVGDRAFLRAIHFYEECRRVKDAVCALKEDRFPDFLDVIRRSGASSFQYLQNVYPPHDLKHQNTSVGLMVSEITLRRSEDAGACRIHGGGFAGTIQAFVKNDTVEIYRKAMDDLFGEGACHVLLIRPFGGVQVI
ncbi:MAG: galactokinase [Eubacterium sp.]|nr:galactokinase [Eubacterium sp.]